MTNSQNRNVQPHNDTRSQEETDTSQYQTMRGCMTLTALTIACGVILVACILLFGKPMQ